MRTKTLDLKTKLDGFLVSTVYLKTDGFYETMVFPTFNNGKPDTSADVWSARTRYERFARDNHERAVATYRKPKED